MLATDVLTVVSAPIARAAGLTPREIAITDDEAGRQAARAVDKDGEDGRPVWVQLRWERDQESADATTGPATVENAVWVAKDLSSARAIYQEQAALNKDFPEAFYGRKGTYPFTISKIGEEGAGISACERSCNAGGEIYVHKRLVSRVANVVSVVYLRGLSHEEGTSDWHARYFGDLVVTRSRGAATGPQV